MRPTGSAQVWDGDAGALIADFSMTTTTRLFENPPSIEAAQFSLDSTKLLSISGETVNIWTLPPIEFTNDDALAKARNSLALRSLKTMLQSYLSPLMVGKKPSLTNFLKKYPEAQQAIIVKLMKDLSILRKDVGAYLHALFPKLNDG